MCVTLWTGFPNEQLESVPPGPRPSEKGTGVEPVPLLIPGPCAVGSRPGKAETKSRGPGNANPPFRVRWIVLGESPAPVTTLGQGSGRASLSATVVASTAARRLHGAINQHWPPMGLSGLIDVVLSLADTSLG